MHDIKYIRENFDVFKKKISKRNNTTNIDHILDLDKKNRKLIQEKEILEKIEIFFVDNASDVLKKALISKLNPIKVKQDDISIQKSDDSSKESTVRH